MLNFLSHIFGKKHPDDKATQPERKKDASVSQDAKLEALKVAEQLPDDESVVVDFVMRCRFADARYVAAQKIHSRQVLEQVRSAMQKTDRRVYRLMQVRLNEMTRSDVLATRVGLLVGKASALAEEPALTPNLVVELDREWQTITENDADRLPFGLKSRFESLRAQLESRLSAQLVLQREVKTAYAELSELDGNPVMTPSERSARLQDFAGKLKEWETSPEQFSLPRQLLADFETKLTALADLSEHFRKEYEAQELRMKWLHETEQSDFSRLDESELKKQWAELPAVRNKKRLAELDERFHAILVQLAVVESSIIDSFPKLELSPSEAKEYFGKHLGALRQAVESGSVQDAVIHDDALRQLETDVLEAGDEQLVQLEHFRAELRRLQGWAKWSGQLSREKLIRFMQELPEQELEIGMLAETVVQAREQWKSLNAVSGMATREQWTQFDDACNRAYEPVLEHARKQASEREKNIMRAESIIENVRAFAHHFESDLADVTARHEQFDWKPVISFYRQTMQLWRQLGMVGRKEKKRLDETFSSVIQPVREKLYAQTQLEIGRRQQLIEEVERIDPAHKDVGRMLHAVQDKWQICARAFPLDNREDKKLWARFREVCERVHACRVEKNRINDLERQQHLRQKEKICAELESMNACDKPGEIEHRLGELLNQWKNVGHVPRDAASEIQNRLDDAVALCRNRIRQLKSERMSELLKGFHDKFVLCCSLEKRIADFCVETENGLIDTVSEDEEFETAWKSLPALPEKMESVLSRRFYNGLKAMAGRNLAYGKRLLENVSSMKENILRFEILYGLESPDYLENERLKKQMEMLQEALGGSETLKPVDVSRQLLELPALADGEDIDRINRLIMKLNEPG